MGFAREYYLCTLPNVCPLHVDGRLNQTLGLLRIWGKIAWESHRPAPPPRGGPPVRRPLPSGGFSLRAAPLSASSLPGYIFACAIMCNAGMSATRTGKTAPTVR